MNYCDGFETDGWLLHEDNVCRDGMPAFWRNLIENSSFREKLVERWFSLREDVLSTDNILNYIDEIAIKLDEPKNRNFEKWNTLDEYVWPNYQLGISYQGEIEFLKYWVFERLSWMDSEINENSTLLGLCTAYEKELIQVVDPLGRNVSNQNAQVLFYIYDNGCIEKNFITYN